MPSMIPLKTPRSLPASFSMPEVARAGRYMNMRSASATPSTADIGMRTSSMLLPNFFFSHFSNFVSVSSMPSREAELSSVLKERIIISTKLTTPRIIGRRKNAHFLRTETNSEFLVLMVPSSRRTETLTRSPLFIITPSRTA